MGFLGGVISAAGGLFGRGTSSSQKQAAVTADLNAALAGDLAAARRVLLAQSQNHTRETKADYAVAEQQLRAQRPDIVAAALGTAPVPAVGTSTPTTSSNPLEQAVQAIEDSIQQGIAGVRQTTATQVQQLGAGGTAALAAGIAPPGSSTKGAISIPTNKTTLLIAGAVVVAIVMLIILTRRS